MPKRSLTLALPPPAPAAFSRAPRTWLFPGPKQLCCRNQPPQLVLTLHLTGSHGSHSGRGLVTPTMAKLPPSTPGTRGESLVTCVLHMATGSSWERHNPYFPLSRHSCSLYCFPLCHLPDHTVYCFPSPGLRTDSLLESRTQAPSTDGS